MAFMSIRDSCARARRDKFAGLSIAITNTGNNNISSDEEEVAIAASRVTQFFAMVRKEVLRMKMTHECTAENFDWRNDHWIRIGGDPANGIPQGPQVPRDGCAVFQSRGGPIPDNIDFEDLAQREYDDTKPDYSVKGGHAVVHWMDKEGAGTDATDVGIEFRGLEPAICSYLLDPVERPDLFHESKSTSGAFNNPPPDYTTTSEIIDEPGNSGQFFAHYGISSNPGCDVGAIVLAR